MKIQDEERPSGMAQISDRESEIASRKLSEDI
jgi:hypothetical protein